MKAFLKKSGLILALAIIGGIGGIVFDRYFLPKFADSLAQSRFSFLKKATETTTIINKTEQVVVREDDSVEKIASQALTGVVRIVSKPYREEWSAGTTMENHYEVNGMVGSGMLVTNDGLIATYRKAIDETKAEYSVRLFNGSVYDAKLVGVDTFTNVAYLKIQATNLPAVALANSDDMRPGKKLIAISLSSQGERGRFATALLNALNKTLNLSGKSVASSEKWEGVLEASFSDQLSYVGGPIINYNGEVVGMEAYTELENQKNYFAIPSNALRSSLDVFLRGDTGNRPSLGIQYLSLTKEEGLLRGIDRDRGALVLSLPKDASVMSHGTTIDAAQLAIGDVILAVNDKEITLDTPLSNAISSMRKGDYITLRIARGSEEHAVPVALK